MSPRRAATTSRFAFLLAVSVLVIAAAGGGCAKNGGAHEVLAIPKTHSYHRETCSRVRMARTVPMTVDEARGAGYAPCPLCRPGT